MTDLFTTKRADGRAEWRVVYDKISTLAYGDQITFEELKQMLDTEDRNRIHRAVGKCNRVLTRENTPRVLGNIRGVGYRILEPADYTPQALAMRKQAQRRMSSAVDLMKTAPLDELTTAQRNWAHQVYMVLVDNDLRLRSQESWRKDAEKRLGELERRAGINAPQIIEGETA